MARATKKVSGEQPACCSSTCCDDDAALHPDHSKQLHRVNRVIGQLEGVKRMIEDRRYCPDILVQTRAAASAVRSLEANILETHLEHCVRDAFNQQDAASTQEKIDELLEIFKGRAQR